jgi:addiction module HigA family antidote
MEDYVNDEKISIKKLTPLQAFLDNYLKALGITFGKFAQHIDTTAARLKKSISGDQKFSPDLALKFGAFFHTSPDLWMKLYFKNEMIHFHEAKKHLKKYKKYNFEKILAGI